jgi:hypothetical protein
MTEKEEVFSNKIKYKGPVSFEKFYQFCYDWLVDEMGLLLSEKKYKEKLVSDYKNLEIEWSGFREMTDYFKMDVLVLWKIIGLTTSEKVEGTKKTKMNFGEFEITIKGNLLRDYKGKFEKSGMHKFVRAVYEKTVIPARIEQFEEKIIEDCSEFLSQVKAYLDLEGKR